MRVPEETKALAAVRFAQDVREGHRRRTPKSDRSRQADINEAMRRLRAAMLPVRRRIAKQSMLADSDDNLAHYERVVELSQALQRERRKLWKMSRR